MSIAFCVLILVSFINLHVQSLSLPVEFPPRPLLPNKLYKCCTLPPYSNHRELPVVYCYLGSPKVILNTWQTVSALIDLSPDQYDLYEGRTSEEVRAQFEAHRSSWSLSFLTFRRKNIQLNPFNTTCLGIRTSLDYRLQLQVEDVDSLRVALFSLGCLLFFLSPSLANNPLFYYLTGISVGMLASVLILFYFLIKLLPLKKPAMLGMMAGGSTIAFYLFQTFYDNILVLLFSYQEYVIGYLLLSALISFIVCYRFGPVSNPRSKNLIKWSLQAFALLLIFFSSHLQEVTLAADVIILSLYNIPIFRWIGSFTRLRFAKFMEGKSHLTRGEMELYEEESKRLMDELLTDDSDDSEED